MKLAIAAMMLFVGLLGPLPAVAMADDAEPPAPEETNAEEEVPIVQWFVRGEAGFLAVASHIIQLSQDGTRFDYRDDGGQDVLFPFFRVETELRFKGRNSVIFLYQPLELRGETVLGRDTTFDGVVFPAGTALNSTYGFPFWRFSYLHDFIDRPDDEVSIGLSLQIRDATITFTSADGTLRADRRDVGPVPTLKFRGRWGFDSGVYLGTEIDGMYAPVSVLNGSDEEVTGAILDASLRVGYEFTDRMAGYLNFRYLGGGAVGTSSDPDPPSDGYTKNWLHFVTVSLGVEFEAAQR